MTTNLTEDKKKTIHNNVLKTPTTRRHKSIRDKLQPKNKIGIFNFDSDNESVLNKPFPSDLSTWHLNHFPLLPNFDTKRSVNGSTELLSEENNINDDTTNDFPTSINRETEFIQHNFPYINISNNNVNDNSLLMSNSNHQYPFLEQIDPNYHKEHYSIDSSIVTERPKLSENEISRYYSIRSGDPSLFNEIHSGISSSDKPVVQDTITSNVPISFILSLNAVITYLEQQSNIDLEFSTEEKRALFHLYTLLSSSYGEHQVNKNNHKETHTTDDNKIPCLEEKRNKMHRKEMGTADVGMADVGMADVGMVDAYTFGTHHLNLSLVSEERERRINENIEDLIDKNIELECLGKDTLNIVINQERYLVDDSDDLALLIKPSLHMTIKNPDVCFASSLTGNDPEICDKGRRNRKLTKTIEDVVDNGTSTARQIELSKRVNNSTMGSLREDKGGNVYNYYGSYNGETTRTSDHVSMNNRGTKQSNVKSSLYRRKSNTKSNTHANIVNPEKGFHTSVSNTELISNVTNVTSVSSVSSVTISSATDGKSKDTSGGFDMFGFGEEEDDDDFLQEILLQNKLQHSIQQEQLLLELENKKAEDESRETIDNMEVVLNKNDSNYPSVDDNIETKNKICIKDPTIVANDSLAKDDMIIDAQEPELRSDELTPLNTSREEVKKDTYTPVSVRGEQENLAIDTPLKNLRVYSSTLYRDLDSDVKETETYMNPDVNTYLSPVSKVNECKVSLIDDDFSFDMEYEPTNVEDKQDEVIILDSPLQVSNLSTDINSAIDVDGMVVDMDELVENVVDNVVNNNNRKNSRHSILEKGVEENDIEEVIVLGTPPSSSISDSGIMATAASLARVKNMNDTSQFVFLESPGKLRPLVSHTAQEKRQVLRIGGSLSVEQVTERVTERATSSPLLFTPTSKSSDTLIVTPVKTRKDHTFSPGFGYINRTDRLALTRLKRNIYSKQVCTPHSGVKSSEVESSGAKSRQSKRNTVEDQRGCNKRQYGIFNSDSYFNPQTMVGDNQGSDGIEYNIKQAKQELRKRKVSTKESTLTDTSNPFLDMDSSMSVSKLVDCEESCESPEISSPMSLFTLRSRTMRRNETERKRTDNRGNMTRVSNHDGLCIILDSPVGA